MRAPIPTAPTSETVRAPVPVPPPDEAWSEAEVDEQPMVPRSWIPTPVDPLIASRRAEEEARAQVEAASVPKPRRRAPTSRYDESSDVGRDDPAPVAGEVSVSVSEEISQAEPEPQRARVQTLRSGEVPILAVPAPVSSTLTTDPGQKVLGYADITGPQPLAQAEITGPIGVSPRPAVHRADASRTTLLWLIAGVLVLLAGGVVALALSL